MRARVEWWIPLVPPPQDERSHIGAVCIGVIPKPEEIPVTTRVAYYHEQRKWMREMKLWIHSAGN